MPFHYRGLAHGAALIAAPAQKCRRTLSGDFPQIVFPTSRRNSVCSAAIPDIGCPKALPSIVAEYATGEMPAPRL